MSTPTITSSPKTGWSNASARPTTPTARVATTSQEFTVKHMTTAEVEEIASAIDAMTLAQRTLTQAQTQIAEARAGIAEARNERTEARAQIAAGSAQVAAGSVQAAVGRALATEGRAQAAAAGARAADAQATMIAQIEKFKENVRSLSQYVKSSDTESPLKINALMDKITAFQTNLPANPDARSKRYAELRAEAKAIQLKISS